VSRRTFVLFLALALTSLGLLACGGDDNAGPSPDGDDAGEAASGPPSTATAEPTQTGRPLLRTSLSGTCRLTPTGADIRVEYSIFATGSAMLTRVRLLEDGREVEDSGPIERRQYSRTAVYHVDAGEQRTYRLAGESTAGSASNVQTTVRCGRVATATPGPRA
jgi:hypothetical protein